MLQCLRRQREFGGSACQRLRRHHDCGVAGHADVNGGSSAAPSSRARSCHGAVHVGGLRALLSFFFIIIIIPCCVMLPERPRWTQWMEIIRACTRVGGADPGGGTQDVNRD